MLSVAVTAAGVAAAAVAVTVPATRAASRAGAFNAAITSTAAIATPSTGQKRNEHVLNSTRD
jgi:uncharacterized transporter YbjL